VADLDIRGILGELVEEGVEFLVIGGVGSDIMAMSGRQKNWQAHRRT
jgi:hypothetical protein